MNKELIFKKSFSNAFDWEYNLRSEKELKERFNNINFNVLLEGLTSYDTWQNSNILQNVTVNDFVVLTLISKYSNKEFNLEDIQKEASAFIKKQQEDLKKTKNEMFLKVLDYYSQGREYRVFYFKIINEGSKGILEFWWTNSYNNEDNLIATIMFEGFDDFYKKLIAIDNLSYNINSLNLRASIDSIQKITGLNNNDKINKLLGNSDYFLNNLKNI